MTKKVPGRFRPQKVPGRIRAVFAVVSCALAVFAGCAASPTKTYSEKPVFTKDKKSVDEGLILIDARPSFENAVARVPGSIPMQWQDFAQKEHPFEGLLEPDLYYHARRLARMGIAPDSKIVVLGNGMKGDGSEGRIAWTLRVMGIENVAFAHVENYSISGTSREAPPPRAAVPTWKPDEQSNLVADKARFENVLYKPRMSLDSPVIIDVRTVEEYTGKTGAKLKVDYGAINVPWTEFLTAKGEPNPNIAKKLESVGVTKNRAIYLIDYQGVRSALATVVLRDLGYEATNFAGGYTLLEP